MAKTLWMNQCCGDGVETLMRGERTSMMMNDLLLVMDDLLRYVDEYIKQDRRHTLEINAKYAGFLHSNGLNCQHQSSLYGEEA